MREQPVQPHYVVCNADESEPGTFKDRVLMESDPFALVEAIAIAAFATGAQKAFIYVRAEYPLAHERMQERDRRAARRTSTDFEIELRIGAGAYVCGEETALFQSIEGYRGEPRNKPPFPVEVGLFGKPTAVNNVETLFNVLEVLRVGGAAYAQTGTEGSTGTRLFCVSGCVERPGLVRAAVRRDAARAARAGRRDPGEGGAARRRGGRVRRAGPARPAAHARGHPRGGGHARLRRRDRLRRRRRPRAARCSASPEFFRDESCGQCVPCRVGTVRQEEALKRLAAGRPHGDERETLAELAQVMRDASICGLGQTAANAVESAIANLGVFA